MVNLASVSIKGYRRNNGNVLKAPYIQEQEEGVPVYGNQRGGKTIGEGYIARFTSWSYDASRKIKEIWSQEKCTDTVEWTRSPGNYPYLPPDSNHRGQFRVYSSPNEYKLVLKGEINNSPPPYN